MAHSLIFGMTESGKTTLAKKLAGALKTKGFSVIVLDPLCSEWSADFQTNDAQEFLRVFWQSKGCHVFIDESGDAIGRYNDIMNKTATRGRHWGHSCYYISQRGAQLSRTIRDQCSHLFLFATAQPDCKIHAIEWNKPELIEAAQFGAGHYLHTTRFGRPERGYIFD